MSNTPFMQFYPGDYLGKTMDLTTEQHGAYLLILMTMWQHDAKLPNDPKKLARIARLTPAKFAAVWSEISRFFEVEGDAITNPRMTKERKKAAEKSQKRATAGSAGGKAKALKDQESRLANAMPLPCHSPDTRDKSIPEANASGRDASESADPKKEFWDKAKAFLSKNGIPQSQSGSFIGKCLKQHGLDRTREAFKAAQSERPAEPIPWITACLTKAEHQPAITDNVIRIAMENMERRDQQRAAR